MTTLLPKPQNAYSVFKDNTVDTREQKSSANRNIPRYRKRKGYVPRKPADFGDGGAFPEIHVAQYPLMMGKPNSAGGQGNVLTPTVDSKGNVQFDAIVQRDGQKVFTKFTDLVEKNDPKNIPLRPDEDTEAQVAKRTTDALSKIVGQKVESSMAVKIPETAASVAAKQQAQYIRYTPGNGNASGKQKIIKMVEAPIDPLEPPRFKHKKLPRGPPEDPVPLMHSPTRKLTAEDQKNWAIPPCISNWKNPRGYTIPLDKRLAADGRQLRDVKINDNFASFAEALYTTEKQAREMVNLRAKMVEKVERKRAEELEEQLAEKAQQALAERANIMSKQQETITEEEREQELARDKLRRDLKRERERELRMEAAGKKTKLSRDENRDFSERIALGMANPNAIKAGADGMFDARLFNQSEGLGAGFAKDDEYGVYSKPLFNKDGQKIYRPKAEKNPYGTAEEQMKELKATNKFKPTKDFEGVDRSAAAKPRDGPVQFEQDADPTEVERHSMTTETRKGRKSLNQLDGRGGSMAASAGSSSRDSLQTSHRSKIRFRKGSN